MRKNLNIGHNCIIEDDVSFGNNVVIKHNCVIEKGVILGDNVYIDSNTIIRKGTTIGSDSDVGSNCIIGEHLMSFFNNHDVENYQLTIGKNALIRSGTIIYNDNIIGDYFQTGHNVTIREKSNIGHHVSVGTLSDIQGNCKIGNYVRMHSNVHIGQLSTIDDFVWIFPYVVLTNDPTPPSENFIGVHIQSFAIVSTSSIVLPGIDIGQDALIGAGTIVNKNVEAYSVIVGNPGKKISDVRNIKNKVTGEPVYPWRDHFKRGMPWSDSGFKTWFESLDISDKIKLT